MESRALCRVCLASDRAMYRVADTPLKETYERVTREKLVVKGRPCCVCSLCLSALRRCRRFIDTAHQSNIALDRWSSSRSPRGKMKLTETPLFSLTRTVTEVIDHMPSCEQPPIKQESDDAANVDDQVLQLEQDDSIPDDEDNIITEEIKYEVTVDPDDDNTHGSDDENDNTQIYDNAGSDETHHSTDDDDNSQRSNVECVNKYDNEIDVEEKTESDDDMPLRSLRSRKRVKLTEDTSASALKKRKPITARHQPKNTDPSAPFFRDGNMYTCRECHHKTNHKGKIKRHFMIHTGEKPFACDKCVFKCRVRSTLQTHVMIHTGEKPFLCDKCDFKSNVKSNFNRHLRIHTAEKPFACNKCDFKSKRKDTLKHHLMMHTDKKPYACNECDSKFSVKSKFNRHLSIHSRKKPFACNKCDFKSKKKEALKQHLMSHAGKTLSACR